MKKVLKNVFEIISFTTFVVNFIIELLGIRLFHFLHVLPQEIIFKNKIYIFIKGTTNKRNGSNKGSN